MTTTQLPGGDNLRKLARIDFAQGYGTDAEFVAHPADANAVTSLGANGGHPHAMNATHFPVVDIDVPCEWVPSSTPGHGHLYINHPVPWSTFLDLLDALVSAGIVERGYAAACEREGFASVRLPWVRKDTPEQEVAR